MLLCYMSTPLMKQYNEIKKRFQESLLFFHLGDFYEMFNEDAELVAKTLGLTLTKRGENPMCGVPVANLHFYIKKLLKETKKSIAICSQLETPDEAKAAGRSLVTRDVVQIITKGTYVDNEIQDNNFILAITEQDSFFSICYADLSSGECYSDEVDKNLLISEILKINPSEIILEKETEYCVLFEDILTIFKTKTESGFELLKQYIEKNKIEFNLSIHKVKSQLFMKFNQASIKNLEILADSAGNTEKSLFYILNKTKTSIGRRILRYNIVRPLININEINKRLDCVEFFKNYIVNKGYIKFPVGDLNKFINNISSVKILRKIGELIWDYFNIYKSINNPPELLKKLYSDINNIDIHEDILKNINEDPGEIGDGTCFTKSEEIIELNELKNKLLTEIFSLPNRYGMNCKVKNNTLIGYFFEFTKNENIPLDWILKQGLATSSRYTNSELIRLESELKIINEKLINIEKILFDNLKKQTLEQKESIEKLGYLIGYIDYFHSCAMCAIEYNYYRPEFCEENVLDIENGRHPVIEYFNQRFITNDLKMNENKTEILISGPNMGGKSTFLRQNALIIMMSQIGMFVPANIKTKIFDGIFVRIGTADNISNNESTFMLEMKECAEILNLSTSNSFIILDEIGRGTSINDCISICTAILEYIHDYLKCFSLISTHFNELTKCEGYLSRFKNYKVDLSIDKENIIFLYKISEGVSIGSFGIHVAKMARMPTSIINRSLDIFKEIS